MGHVRAARHGKSVTHFPHSWLVYLHPLTQNVPIHAHGFRALKAIEKQGDQG